MKRLIAAVVLIIIIVALSITGSNLIDKYCNALINETEKCEKLFLSDFLTEETLFAFENNFKKAEKILAIFANRQHIDDIGVIIGRLKAFEKATFLGDLAEIKARLYDLREDETLNIKSFY